MNHIDVYPSTTVTQTQSVDRFGNITPFTVARMEDIDVTSEDFSSNLPFLLWIEEAGTIKVMLSNDSTPTTLTVEAINNFQSFLVKKVYSEGTTLTTLKAGW